MLANEVFIDAATLRENVVSLARNVGYIPRSPISAKAKISFNKDIAYVELLEDEYGISPGQACVLYNKNKYGYKVLGGGWIFK